MDHAALEKQVSVRGRELLRLVLQAHLDLRAAREERQPAVTGPDGIARTRAEKGHARALASVFGQVTVSRIAYRARGAPNVHPLDEQLNLPPGKYSHGLCEMAGVRGRAGLDRGRMPGSVPPDRGAGRYPAGLADHPRRRRRLRGLLRRGAGRPAAGHRAGAGPGGRRQGHQDAAGLAAPGGRPRRGRGGAPGRPGGCRKARSAPASGWPRPARSSTGRPHPGPPPASSRCPARNSPRRPARPPAGRRTRRSPTADNKYLTASVAKTTGEVMAGVFAEADRRDPARERSWIALADGNKDQLAHSRPRPPPAASTMPVLIDVIHVTEYLWDAAWCFFPEASPDAGTWVRGHARAILDGHAPEVATAIRGSRHRRPVRQQAQDRPAHRPLPGQTRPLPGLPPLPGQRLADLHRRHRRRLPPPDQRPHGHHRRPLEHRRRRSHPQPPRHPRQRRLGRLLGLAPAAPAPPHLPRHRSCWQLAA